MKWSTNRELVQILDTLLLKCRAQKPLLRNQILISAMAILVNIVGTDSVLRLKLKDVAELQRGSTRQRTTEITVRDVAPLAATR